MTLQEHYNAIKNGKGNKDQFLKQARQLFPQYLNQYSDFNTATNVLKSKQIISEAAGGVVTKGFDIFDWKKILAEETKAVEKEISKEAKDANKYAYNNADMKNADNINFNEIMKGFYAELKDAKNHDKTGDELKAIVVKNLAKDPLYYTKDGEFGVKGIGYTDEAPGLGKNTQPTSKNASVLGGNDETNSYSDIVKNSLVGSTKKNVKDTLSDSEAKDSMPKKVKEMPDKGVSGVEKKIKLQEGFYGPGNTREVSKDEFINIIKKDPIVKDWASKGWLEASKDVAKGSYILTWDDEHAGEIKGYILDILHMDLEESIDEIVTGENPYFDTDPSDGDADHDKNMQYGAENYYDKGKKAFDEGDLEKAQEYYEQALEFGSWLGWTERDLPPYSSLEEAMVQGTIVNPKGGGKGEQKIPRAVFLSKEAIDQINDRFPGSIKLISKGKETSMFISQLFAIALGALSRGRYSPDTERKKPELAKFVADAIPTLIRGKIKKELVAKPTDIAGNQMHYVKLKLVPKKDGTGYWIPLMGEFDPLMTENEEENNDLFNTREKAENIAKQRSYFNKNEIYYVEEENGKYKAVESMHDEPPRGVYFQNGNRKGGSYMSSPGNDPGNVYESKLRSIISQIIKEELKK